MHVCTRMPLKPNARKSALPAAPPACPLPARAPACLPACPHARLPAWLPTRPSACLQHNYPAVHNTCVLGEQLKELVAGHDAAFRWINEGTQQAGRLKSLLAGLPWLAFSCICPRPHASVPAQLQTGLPWVPAGGARVPVLMTCQLADLRC